MPQIHPNQSIVPGASASATENRWHAPLQTHLAHHDTDFDQYQPYDQWTVTTGPVNYLILADATQAHPDAIFNRLRWGGQVACAVRSNRELADLSRRLASLGFAIDHPAQITSGRWPRLLHWLGPSRRVLLARKTSLIRPSELTERFTYSVELVPAPANSRDTHAEHGSWCVLKQSPPMDRLMARLTARFPQMDPAQLHKRAIKFTERIFPLFLTREAAILQLLEQRLPPAYRHRVPRLLKIEKDAHGYVRKLWMTWLRNGGEPLSQLDFARQSADLLRVLHDVAGIMHLDLRLDNMVITPRGVGFVDFGSAVRVGEDICGNALLAGIFEELMRTSEIQRMLSQMWCNGMVTSQAIGCGRQKVHKAVDFFYLVLQMNHPLSNPDFAGLVRQDPSSLQGRQIHHLSQEVLRPADPAHPRYRSAADILKALDQLDHLPQVPVRPQQITGYAEIA